MPGSHTEIYLHIVWATSGRQPLLKDQAREMAYRIVQAECDGLHVQTVALGGVDDHVHLLVRVPAVVEPSRLAKQVKGVSSHSLRRLPGMEGFGWQEGYSAFSVSRWDVPKLARYIQDQDRHHQEGTTKPALEQSEG